MTAMMEASVTSSTSCPPRFATRRRPERETFGHELAAIAERFRPAQPFMPWQRLVADVGCEIHPATGLPAYREVRVTIPRQSGKTTLFLAWQINRCVSNRWSHPQRSAFTAQTGKDARDKWIDELFPLIRNSPLSKLVATTPRGLAINEGMGNESIRFKTGSLIRLLSTATTSGHSKTLHQAVMDEVWHDTDDRREQGLRPAMITMADAQLLVCSTAGTDASMVLNRKVETGRAAVQADIGEGVAYFEWSAPDGWDPEDEVSYFDFMPALCPDPPCRCSGTGERWRHTITLRELRAERLEMQDNGHAEFRRAYGNRKTSNEGGVWQVIPEAAWLAAQSPRLALTDPVALGVDVTPDRTWAAIGAAGRLDGGGRAVELVEHRPGTSWVTARLRQLVDGHRPCVVVTSDRALADAAEEADLTVYRAGSGDLASAASMVFDGLAGESPDVQHLPDAELTAAVAGATKRQLGDGWAWDRRSVSVNICPLVACSLALWGLGTPRIQTSTLAPFALIGD